MKIFVCENDIFFYSRAIERYLFFCCVGLPEIKFPRYYPLKPHGDCTFAVENKLAYLRDPPECVGLPLRGVAPSPTEGGRRRLSSPGDREIPSFIILCLEVNI